MGVFFWFVLFHAKENERNETKNRDIIGIK